MMLPCLLLAWALTMAAPLSVAPPQQPLRIVLVDDTTELEAALASRTPPRQVPVRVVAISLPDDDPAKVRVLIVAEIDERQEADGLASVAYAVNNERGQRQAYALRRAELRRTPAATLAFSEVVVVPAGIYRLTLAAMRNSRVGTVATAVTARLQAAASLRVGDLLIGESQGDDLATSISIDRRVHGDRLVASLPVAASDTLPTDLGITVEVARDQTGAAILSAPAPIVPGEGRVRVAQVVVDTRVLPAGDYTARATVSIGGKELTRVFAPFTLGRAAAAGAGAASRGPSSSSAAGAAPAPPSSAAGFRPEDVLDAAVLTPFLDELAARASDRMRPAIDQAKAGRFVEAAQAVTVNDPDDPVRPFLQGLSLLSRKQLQPASEAFRETLRAAPDFFVGAFYIGACYAAGGRDPQAINAWQTSLVGLDHYPVVYRMMAEAMARVGQGDRAIETLEEAASKWPDDRTIRLRLARLALDAHRYDRVLVLVDEGLARASSDSDLLFVGMQAIFERVTQAGAAPQNESIARLKRYRDAYVAAGGPRQSLVAEWVAAVEKRVPQGTNAPGAPSVR